MLIGYARVSTEDQNTNAQTDALKASGCELIYSEKKSGRDLKRPLFLKILSNLKDGDVLVVYKIDRIARSLRDLLKIIDEIESVGAAFKSLTEAIDTSNPAGRMIFQVLGAFAEFERMMISERTKAGLKAAIARGSRPGIQKKTSDEKEKEILDLYYNEKISVINLSNHFGIPRGRIYRTIERDIKSKQKALF